MTEAPITIHEAKALMEILDKDIPSWEQSRIALILLILSANPLLAKDGKEIIAKSKREGRTSSYCGMGSNDYGENDYYDEYYGY